MMKNKKVFDYTVSELIKTLQQFPEDMPVIVSGYENGYENFYEPAIKKIKHLPESPYYDGEFQLDENGTEALILESVVRFD